METKRPHFYRIDSADFFAMVMQYKSEKELGKFIKQFSIDLVTGVPNSSYATKLIAEATDYIRKKQEAGSKGGKQKSSTAKAPLKQKSSTGLANSSSSNNIKEKVKKEKTPYADHVSLTAEEHGKLISDHGEEKTAWMIQKLNAYKGSSGKKYKSDYLAILSWVVEKAAAEFSTNLIPFKRGLVL